MFKNQLKDLSKVINSLGTEIADLESNLKAKKEELKDVKQAHLYIERIQSKYDEQIESVESCVQQFFYIMNFLMKNIKKN